MAAANKKKAGAYRLAMPSSHPSSSSNKDSEHESKHRRRREAWLSPTNCNRLYLFFGVLCLAVLFLMSIGIPLGVVLKRSVAEISSTTTTTGSTITTTTETSTTETTATTATVATTTVTTATTGTTTVTTAATTTTGTTGTTGTTTVTTATTTTTGTTAIVATTTVTTATIATTITVTTVTLATTATTTTTVTTATTTTTSTTTCSPMFLNQTTYSTGAGSSPNSVAVVDVNSDNKPDIVVADYTSNNIGIFFNAGNGTFLNQTIYSTGAGSNPMSVAVVDVNSDNKPDIVVANYGTNNVGVFLNAGNGTLLAQTIYSTGAGSNPTSVAVVDVNSDNQPDIVVANSVTNNVGVFFNAGNGIFLAQTTYSTGAGSTPRSVVVVDVNSDNQPDIVVGNYGTNTVGIFLNAGNGTFLNQTTYPTGAASNARSVAVVDVNSDNKPDIVVADYTSNNVGVFLNAGNGTFLNQTTYSSGVGSAPRSVAVIDVNSDSKPDIVVANSVTNNVGVFLNAGNGTFLNQTTYSCGAGSTPRSVAVVDVNNDNQPDIVVADYTTNNVGVFLHC